MGEAASEKKHGLSIYLLKDSYISPINCLRKIEQAQKYTVPLEEIADAHLYIGKTSAKEPSWSILFPQITDWREYKTQTVKAVLLIQSKTREKWFAITFGYGKSFLNPMAFVENFGFKAVVNSINPEELRTVDKTSIIENPLHIKGQAAKGTDISHFRFDSFTDFLSRIRASSDDNQLGATLDGKDALKLSVDVVIEDLPELLDHCYDKFKSERYKEYLPEIDNLFDVRDKEKISQLNHELLDRINNRKLDSIWMSMPSFPNEDSFDCFHYSCDRGETIHRDLELRDYLRLKVRKKDRQFKEINLSTLKRDKVQERTTNGDVFDKWSVWKCIYAEIKIGLTYFILYSGEWYELEQQYIEKVNRKFNNCTREDPTFPVWSHDIVEEEYLKSLEAVANDELCLMDRKLIQGEGRSRIEFCDLYSKNYEIIHVKRYGDSGVLSKLFDQGQVSASLFLNDAEFRHKIREKLGDEFPIDTDNKPAPGKYIVWFVIGTKYIETPHLPLFAKIVFVNTVQLLENFRFKVKIGYIPVEIDISSDAKD